MKLDNLNHEDFSVITQSNHGAAQDDKAFDIAVLEGFAQAKGRVISYHPQKDSRLDYFRFAIQDIADNFIEYVHAKPLVPIGKVVELGTLLWKSTWHHVHPALNWIKNWWVLYDFMRRDIELFWQKRGLKHPVWTNWSTYADRQLPPFETNVIVFEMVKLQQPLKCISTNTVDMNVRKEPTSKAESIGKMVPNTSWQTDIVAKGEDIQGVNTWYGYNGGYVSGKWVKELPNTNNAELEQKVIELTQENAALEAENTDLSNTVDKYKPGYDAAILINSVQ